MPRTASERLTIGRAIRLWWLAFVRYHRGLGRIPRTWKPWGGALVAANMIVPLFLFPRFEALLVFACALLNGAIFVTITALAGFSRLLGLGHIPWIFLVGFLVTRLDDVPADDFFGWWLRAVILLDCGSIVLDAANVIAYFAGDRDELVAGLGERPNL